jgi:hypothetical protein
MSQGIENTISANSIHDNTGKGIENIDGGNTEPVAPVVSDTGSANGTACPECVVDVFSDSEDEGRVYHGTVTAGIDGSWSISDALAGPFMTATATDLDGNTSEFSAPFPYEQMAPWTHRDTRSDGDGDPRPRIANCDPNAGPPLGDNQCDGDIDPVDALADLRDVAGLSPVSQTEPCPDVRIIVDVIDASPHLWGDSDCDNDVDAVDALAILRSVAGLAALGQTEPCPDIGAQIKVKG